MKSKIFFLTALLVLILGMPSMADNNPAQARLMAKRAAIADAQRNLSEKIYGIFIDSTTNVKEFISRDDRIRGVVLGFIKGAEIISESYNDKDGSYKVTLQIAVERLKELIGKNFKYDADFIEADGNGASKNPTPGKKNKKKPKKLKAKGKGTMPKDKEISKEQRILMAQRAAKLDAYRNLIEYI